ncbi:MAG TPA: hypothetical protein VKZ53_05565 [Candidatus Angelobacter sp.]|nr:hypothetical protein [Candidatus Angelobacter sp.]
MRFAKIVFRVAGVWGILVLTPLFFLLDMVGRQDPPPVTHPAFYYGFASTAWAFQVAFLIIGSNPLRFRPLMIPSMIEKFGYAIALVILYLQARVNPRDLVFGGVDFLLGVLFVISYLKTAGETSGWESHNRAKEANIVN